MMVWTCAFAMRLIAAKLPRPAVSRLSLQCRSLRQSHSGGTGHQAAGGWSGEHGQAAARACPTLLLGHRSCLAWQALKSVCSPCLPDFSAGLYCPLRWAAISSTSAVHGAIVLQPTGSK